MCDPANSIVSVEQPDGKWCKPRARERPAECEDTQRFFSSFHVLTQNITCTQYIDLILISLPQERSNRIKNIPTMCHKIWPRYQVLARYSETTKLHLVILVFKMLNKSIHTGERTEQQRCRVLLTAFFVSLHIIIIIK